MAHSLNLVNAGAGQRLAAKVIDAVPLLLIWVVIVATGAFGPGATAAGRLGASGIGAVLALAYLVWLWIWEARTGKTPGNLLVGLRTAAEDGFTPGLGAILVRDLIMGIANIVPVVGPVVVIISNLWDANSQRQGWHDKTARTLVVDVRAGRDPLTTGGLYGPQAFAPREETPHPSAAAPSSSCVAVTPPAPAAPPVRHPAPAAPSVTPSAAAAHPDDELDMTRMAPAASAADGVQLVFDDGTAIRVRTEALIGRNPSARPGETVEQLVDVADLDRSVSKTHLYVRVDGSGLWVTDRDSTNGSAITVPDGHRTSLTPMEAVLVPAGGTVHLGDRHFVVAASGR